MEKRSMVGNTQCNDRTDTLFDYKMLQKILKDDVVRGNQRVPNKAACEMLVLQLARTRRRANFLNIRQSNSFRNVEPLRNAIQKSLDHLTHAVPEMLDNIKQPEAWGALALAADLPGLEIDVLEDFARSLDDIRGLVCMQPHRVTTKARKIWHGVVKDLAKAFLSAMKATNPSASFGKSDNGPVVRFLSAIMPLITGEAPSPTTIEQFLRRADQKRATNSRTRM